MREFLSVFGLITFAAIIFGIIVIICRYLSVWTWTSTWIFSSREEKMNLTKERGLFNSNGYFIPSESLGDVSMCYTGSFKRFDNVEDDPDLTGVFPASPSMTDKPPGYPQEISLPYRTVQTTDLSDFTNDLKSVSSETGNVDSFSYIPPQPLRVAPQPPVPKKMPPKRPPPPVPPRGTVRKENVSYSAESDGLPEGVQRALSCDSVFSDTSVEAADLEETHITGSLCVGIDYDSESGDLAINILEARNLISDYHKLDPQKLLDTFIRVFLLPDTNCSVQTRLYKSSNSPSYQEKFLFGLDPSEFTRRSFMFHVYSWDNSMCTLIGEGELRLAELPSRRDLTTWVPLTDTGQGIAPSGEIMLSLNYLPTAERLIVVVVKARNLVFQNGQDTGDSFIKVYLLKEGRKISKKKTSAKKRERNPIFNEAMIFSVSLANLEVTQIRATASEVTNTGNTSLGHVIIGGSGAAGTKSSAHWQQMLAAPRKPIAMWHSLRI